MSDIEVFKQIKKDVKNQLQHIEELESGFPKGDDAESVPLYVR